MKKLLLILPLLVIFFASCEKDNIWKPDVENPGDGKETGKVTLSVKQEGAFTVVTKSEDAVAVADLRIRIWKGDVIVKEYAKYSQAPNVVELEPGNYTLEAGTTGDKEAAWARQSRGVDPPVQIRRGERAQRRGCRKTSVFLSRETGISGNFVGRIKGAKCPFDLQFLTWDFS